MQGISLVTIINVSHLVILNLHVEMTHLWVLGVLKYCLNKNKAYRSLSFSGTLGMLKLKPWSMSIAIILVN